MAQNDLLKRYLDAGLAFTALTQERAERLVKDLVKAGEIQSDQARETVADLLERSRKSSEKLLATVRTEVRSQITSLGLASQADLDRIEQRVQSLIGQIPTPPKQSTAKPSRPAKKAPATRKAPAKKQAPAKKKASATRKAPAKKKA